MKYSFINNFNKEDLENDDRIIPRLGSVPDNYGLIFMQNKSGELYNNIGSKQKCSAFLNGVNTKIKGGGDAQMECNTVNHSQFDCKTPTGKIVNCCTDPTIAIIKKNDDNTLECYNGYSPPAVYQCNDSKYECDPMIKPDKTKAYYANSGVCENACVYNDCSDKLEVHWPYPGNSTTAAPGAKNFYTNVLTNPIFTFKIMNYGPADHCDTSGKIDYDVVYGENDGACLPFIPITKYYWGNPQNPPDGCCNNSLNCDQSIKPSNLSKDSCGNFKLSKFKFLTAVQTYQGFNGYDIIWTQHTGDDSRNEWFFDWDDNKDAYHIYTLINEDKIYLTFNMSAGYVRGYKESDIPSGYSKLWGFHVHSGSEIYIVGVINIEGSSNNTRKQNVVIRGFYERDWELKWEQYEYQSGTGLPSGLPWKRYVAGATVSKNVNRFNAITKTTPWLSNTKNNLALFFCMSKAPTNYI